jgi:pyruvate carboxylase subunit B
VEVLGVRFRLNIDGAEHRVITGADGTLLFDDIRHEAKVTAPAPDRRVVQVGGKTYEIRVVEEHPDLRTYVLEVAGERVRLGVTELSTGGAPRARVATVGPSGGVRGAPDAGDGGIMAPMPGRVARLLVTVGEKIEPGQVLLVLEAMKMENEIRAPREGVVKSVLVREGDPVETGRRLIELE